MIQPSTQQSRQQTTQHKPQNTSLSHYHPVSQPTHPTKQCHTSIQPLYQPLVQSLTQTPIPALNLLYPPIQATCTQLTTVVPVYQKGGSSMYSRYTIRWYTVLISDFPSPIFSTAGESLSYICGLAPGPEFPLAGAVARITVG